MSVADAVEFKNKGNAAIAQKHWQVRFPVPVVDCVLCGYLLTPTHS